MLNPIEEAKFAELKEKCRELKVPPPPEIHIGLKVVDRNGVLVFDDKQRGHSWTRNFYNAAFLGLCGAYATGGSTWAAGYLNGKKENGSAQYYVNRSCQSDGYSHADANAYSGIAATSGANGIKIGTGDTAFSAEHYTLASLISHGAGPGQMSYTAMAQPVASYNSGTKVWKNTLIRVFNNNSSGSITVKEVGLVWKGLLTGDAGIYFMFERSVLDPTVPVAVGAQMTVTYELSMDFSAIDS